MKANRNTENTKAGKEAGKRSQHFGLQAENPAIAESPFTPTETDSAHYMGTSCKENMA